MDRCPVLANLLKKPYLGRLDQGTSSGVKFGQRQFRLNARRDVLTVKAVDCGKVSNGNPTLK